MQAVFWVNDLMPFGHVLFGKQGRKRGLDSGTDRRHHQHTVEHCFKEVGVAGGRSGAEISFPKVSLDRAIGVARAMQQVSRSVSRRGIALEMELRPGTGSINNRVIAARKFGLIARGASKGYVLTALGRRFAAGTYANEDVLAAIRHVPVFAAALASLHGSFDGVSRADLLDALSRAGVEEAELDDAVRVLSSSMTFSTTASVTKADCVDPGVKGKVALGLGNGAQNGAGSLSTEPMIKALFAATPPPSSSWPADRMNEWLDLFANAVRYIYTADARAETAGAAGPAT